MSKSDENAAGAIFLLDDADTITKKIKRAVTDSGTDINFDENRPAIRNLLTIYQLLTAKRQTNASPTLSAKATASSRANLPKLRSNSYGLSKNASNNTTTPTLTAILKSGAEKAASVASVTLNTVYERMGIM